MFMKFCIRLTFPQFYGVKPSNFQYKAECGNEWKRLRHEVKLIIGPVQQEGS